MFVRSKRQERLVGSVYTGLFAPIARYTTGKQFAFDVIPGQTQVGWIGTGVMGTYGTECECYYLQKMEGQCAHTYWMGGILALYSTERKTERDRSLQKGPSSHPPLLR